jgi:peptidoglycan hydrolase-like protein with peptidoglycan-binding domain
MIYNNLRENRTDIVTRLLALVVFALVSVAMFGFALLAHADTLTSTMKMGSRGTNVTSLQTFLATNPSFYPEGIISGYYGSLTEAAVERFQSFYGIVSSGTPSATGYGNVGPITLAKLNSLIPGGVSSGSAAPAISNVSVQLGSTSAIVSWMTNNNSQGKIYYSTQPIQMTEAQADATAPIISGSSQVDTNSVISHSIALQSLNSNTTYYYVVQSTDSSGNVSITWPTTFKTNN